MSGHGEDLWDGPYLEVEPEAVARWQPTIADRRLLHIGLHWRAERKHLMAQQRSLTLKELSPLFSIRGARFYSLQYGAGEEITAYPSVIDMGAIDHPTERFCQTTGVLKCLDLVICVDSSIAHLAGAIGTPPVWLLLDFCHDPRWALKGQTSAWYPTHRLYRSDEFDDFPGLVSWVAEDLEELVQRRRT